MKNFLKTWRVNSNKSVTEAASDAGVTPAMWSRWENDRRRVPAERAVSLEERIGIPKHKLRPDLFKEGAA